MSVAVVTGSGGLIGSEAVRHFHDLGWDVVGIDNDMRARFFGAEASTRWMRERLETDLQNYRHLSIDIRDEQAVARAIRDARPELVIHTAAQPSHDWAAREPFT